MTPAGGSVAAPPSPGRRQGVADSLLDAVTELLADRTWAEVRMADVGARAGVSRQTVYNAFGSREGLAQAYVLRESEAFLTAVEATIAGHADDPVAALGGALEIFLAAAETHPLVRAISASEQGDELLVLVTTRGGPVLDPLTARLSELIAETWPPVERRSAGLAADTLVRLAISHAALPGGSPAEVASQVAEILGPYVRSELSD